MIRLVKEPGGRVLALGAHPDDLEIGAGGTLARLAAEGAAVTMVVIAIPSAFATRRDEAWAAARMIGANLRILCDAGPSRVEDTPMHELVRRLDALIGDLRPSLVLTHSDKDLHWDHGLVHRASLAAVRRTPCDLLAYLSSPEMNAHPRDVGDCFVDITGSIDTKLAAIRCHTSQLDRFDVESSRDLARAVGRTCGYEYAETFHVLRVRL